MYMMLVVWAEPKQHTRQGELIGRQSYTCRRAECSEAGLITRAAIAKGPNTTEDSAVARRFACRLIWRLGKDADVGRETLAELGVGDNMEADGEETTASPMEMAT
jgi:hypothetical protein